MHIYFCGSETTILLFCFYFTIFFEDLFIRKKLSDKTALNLAAYGWQLAKKADTFGRCKQSEDVNFAELFHFLITVVGVFGCF